VHSLQTSPESLSFFRRFQRKLRILLQSPEQLFGIELVIDFIMDHNIYPQSPAGMGARADILSPAKLRGIPVWQLEQFTQVSEALQHRSHIA